MTHFVWSQLYENMSWIKNITSNTLFCSVVYIVLLFPIQFCFSLFGHVKWSYSILFYFILLYHVHWWHFIVYSIGRIQFYFTVMHWSCSDILFSFGLLFHVCLCCSSSFSSILFLLMHCFLFYSICSHPILVYSYVLGYSILYCSYALTYSLLINSILFYLITFWPLLFYGFFSSGLFSFTLFVIYVQLCFSFSILFVFVMFCCKCLGLF